MSANVSVPFGANSSKLRLPHSKLKVLIKSGDPDAANVTPEAVFAIGKAVEMFIGSHTLHLYYLAFLSFFQAKHPPLGHLDTFYRF
jgi:hypothetical protein